MPNDHGNSGNGTSPQGNGTHKEEIRKQKPNVPPELLTYLTHGFAAGNAEAELEHAKWKSKKALDDVVGKDTDKWTKRFCVTEVAVYHNSVKLAEGRPNAEAIRLLAWRTALSGLSKLFPDIPREKLAQLLVHKPEELEDP
jgi:hypothetical protein